MSSISASIDPSEEARLLYSGPNISSTPRRDHQTQDTESESEEELDEDGFIRSNERVFSLSVL